VTRMCLVVTSLFVSVVLAGFTTGPLFAGQDNRDILTADHYLSHTSTAPAIRGQQVTLYLRERALANLTSQSASLEGKVVVFVHGAALGSTGAFDAPYQDYSWMAFLAQAGFDAFGLDLTGYGYSTRPGPMNDPCNLDPQERATLVPALHAETCPSTKPVQIDTLRSDWDDVDAAVNFIRDLRHVERVSLVGWSYGGSIIGGYAAGHPDAVDRLVMLSPSYDRDHPDASAPEAPASGPPMFLQTADTVPSLWDPQVQCPDQVDPGIRDALWQEGVVADAVSWAPGLRRVPTFPTWSWNRSISARVQAPTLVVEGEFDHLLPGSTTPDAIRAAYADLGTSSKVYVDLACSSHFAMWETRHVAMFQASLEWLGGGSVSGQSAGIVRLGD
jgi:pimeloyl-ACP methyl ester carboxylesterase